MLQTTEQAEAHLPNKTAQQEEVAKDEQPQEAVEPNVRRDETKWEVPKKETTEQEVQQEQEPAEPVVVEPPPQPIIEEEEEEENEM